MTKSILITATSTEVGKTYISGLIIKRMLEGGCKVGYFKPALSGTDVSGETDLGYIVKTAGKSMPSACPYIYSNSVSPHLAGQLENNAVDMEVVKAAYNEVAGSCDYVVIEGAGGIAVPIIYNNQKITMLTEVAEQLTAPAKPKVIVVTDCKLGTINHTCLTVEHLKSKGFDIAGIIFNRYQPSVLADDNIKMIELITGISAVDKVSEGKGLNISSHKLAKCF